MSTVHQGRFTFTGSRCISFQGMKTEGATWYTQSDEWVMINSPVLSPTNCRLDISMAQWGPWEWLITQNIIVLSRYQVYARPPPAQCDPVSLADVTDQPPPLVYNVKRVAVDKPCAPGECSIGTMIISYTITKNTTTPYPPPRSPLSNWH